ncbi:MAG: Fur family transcriptional regulator [Longimicrobiaceae bacterium]
MATESLGQRRTPQRQAIQRVIERSSGPLTVGEIQLRAQQRVARLGIATVYRTVGLLRDAGWLREVVLPSGETRYEQSGLGHHHHFQCRICDQVTDLDECPVSIPDRDDFSGGFVVESHEVTLYGVCPECG